VLALRVRDRGLCARSRERQRTTVPRRSMRPCRPRSCLLWCVPARALEARGCIVIFAADRATNCDNQAVTPRAPLGRHTPPPRRVATPDRRPRRRVRDEPGNRGEWGVGENAARRAARGAQSLTCHAPTVFPRVHARPGRRGPASRAPGRDSDHERRFGRCGRCGLGLCVRCTFSRPDAAVPSMTPSLAHTQTYALWYTPHLGAPSLDLLRITDLN
jgi:hypothetical protein